MNNLPIISQTIKVLDIIWALGGFGENIQFYKEIQWDWKGEGLVPIQHTFLKDCLTDDTAYFRQSIYLASKKYPMLDGILQNKFPELWELILHFRSRYYDHDLESDDGASEEAFKEEVESLQKDPEGIDEVVEATSLTSEDVHGGDEATGDIEDSPNHKDDGSGKEKSDVAENASEKDKRESKGQNGKPKDSNSEEEKEPQDEKDDSDKSESESDKKGGPGDGQGTGQTSGPKKDEGAVVALEELISKFQQQQPCKQAEYFNKVKALLKKEISSGGSTKSHKIDKKGLIMDKYRCKYLSMMDKKKRESDKKINLFLDMSGSISEVLDDVVQILRDLVEESYEIVLYNTANGFLRESMLSKELKVKDDYYNTYSRLLGLSKSLGKRVSVGDICSPCLEDAMKIVDSADTVSTLIIADYDGFSDFVALSMGVKNIPIFLSVEDRYDDPLDHDWVNPNFSVYPEKYYIRFWDE